jgi:hypothetical protein
MPRKMVILKLFNGKEYGLVASEFSEKRAKRKADGYRSIGYNARVVRFGKNAMVATREGSVRAGRKIFAVYVSNARREK